MSSADGPFGRAVSDQKDLGNGSATVRKGREEDGPWADASAARKWMTSWEGQLARLDTDADAGTTLETVRRDGTRRGDLDRQEIEDRLRLRDADDQVRSSALRTSS